MLSIKRVYEPAGPEDGFRILVDRLWPRGVSKDKAAIGLWLKDIAPSDSLRKWFGHDPARWEEFKKRYENELDAMGDTVKSLATRAKSGKVTLVFGAKDNEHNQAVVLKGYIEKMK
jgi:uncharacterized protein YeaO (DUF488 family)